ncbi:MULTISPECIES: SDR family NAD(P)-dependent oxidoreductase [Legionella]|uniref:Acetyoacetyl CoA reductase n=1 Tax=Legionella drozanskii LLAP-1 TaxID=1212489 RepID=A0A0W0T0W6_9GAMM|nr:MULTISPECIES: SDR family oxidoreductase [Legionella]KTC89251.1 acetyoacetyl CoA reductase [Legionella drozanskii LLAP-1]PJE13401.1 MAG: NAD(P)-dependent oxidoreductase [Legionella sp.]
MSNVKTIVITGASQGIGADTVELFLNQGYQVVANSRHISESGHFKPSDRLKLIDGDIGQPETAKRIIDLAISEFGNIDALVNNAGIFFTKPFIEYTADDFKRLLSTNVAGFIYVTQLAIKQMLKQGGGGSIVTVTASLVDNPIAGMNASLPMITKGGLDSVTRSLAMEYAKDSIRFNTVAPGTVDTPLHKNTPNDFLRTLSPMGILSEASEIAEAIFFLTESKTITGETLHVDGGAHLGKW